MNARIFNIQKFSLHDGPGIRSVVFFKGCPLHCPWCANPESQTSNIQVGWDENKCQHCLICTTKSNLQYTNKRIVAPYYDEQINYEQLCLHHALQVEGKDISIQEIVDEVLLDVPFYEESNGGVTFSGGEALLQPDAIILLAKQLKQHNIHLALETTGCIQPVIFKECIRDIDLLLYDIKHYDTIKHKEIIGAPLTHILANVEYALHTNKQVIVRIPIIPGFNDSLDDAKQFTKLFQAYRIKEVQLLAFHQFGSNKYKRLDISYTMQTIQPISKESLQAFQTILCEAGIHCYI